MGELSMNYILIKLLTQTKQKPPGVSNLRGPSLLSHSPASKFSSFYQFPKLCMCGSYLELSTPKLSQDDLLIISLNSNESSQETFSLFIPTKAVSPP